MFFEGVKVNFVKNKRLIISHLIKMKAHERQKLDALVKHFLYVAWTYEYV